MHMYIIIIIISYLKYYALIKILKLFQRSIVVFILRYITCDVTSTWGMTYSD